MIAKTIHLKNMSKKKSHSVLDQYSEERINSGWYNSSTGWGVNTKMQGTFFSGGGKLSFEDIEGLFRSSWVARKAIELPVFDMTREWIDILEDEEEVSGFELAEDELERLNWQKVTISAQMEADKHGGALIVFTFDDGDEYWPPVNPNTVRGIKRVDIVPKFWATPTSWYSDFNDPKRGEVEHYTVTFQYQSMATAIPVHESRCIRVEAPYTSPYQKIRNASWNDSRYQHIYEAIKSYDVSVQSGSDIMQMFSFMVLRINDLRDRMASGMVGAVFNRLTALISKISSSKIAVIGEAEEIEHHAATVTGLAELMERYEEYVAAAANIPRSRFIGGQSGGLGGSVIDGDTVNYYDWIKGRQEQDLRPVIRRWLEFVSYYIDFNWEKIDFDFCSLWQLTDLEKAESYSKVAQADNLYIQNGTLYPSEVSISRFGGKEFDSTSMHLETVNRDEMKEIDEVTPDQAETIMEPKNNDAP